MTYRAHVSDPDNYEECEKCGGLGKYTCKTCGGKGSIEGGNIYDGYYTMMGCGICVNEGTIKCDTCDGTGSTRKKEAKSRPSYQSSSANISRTRLSSTRKVNRKFEILRKARNKVLELHKKGDHDGVIYYAYELMVKYPRYKKECNYFIGRAYVYKQNYSMALLHLNRATPPPQEDFIKIGDWADFYIAQAHYHKGNFKNALPIINKAIALIPDFDFAYSLRARIYQELRRYQDAISDLTTAINLRPETDSHYVFRGLLYSNDKNPNKDYQKAIDDFLVAIRLDPQNYHTYVSVGDCLKGLDSRLEALACYGFALERARRPAETNLIKRRIESLKFHK